jgi:hypothetical protein
MRVERLKRWQWMIVGAFLGATIATMKLWAGFEEPRETQTVAPHIFENQLMTGDDPSRKPALQVGLVVLHPPEEVVVPGSKQLEKREVITYYAWFPDKKNEKGEVIARPKPHRVILDQASMNRSPYLGDVSKLTGREYLAKLKNHIQKLDRKQWKYAQNFEYRYAWLETPKGAYMTYSLGGLLVVGLLWPTVMNLLAGAGYGRPIEDEDEAYLARFKGSRIPVVQPKRTGATEEEMAELLRLEAALEAKLKDSGLEMTQPVGLAAGASTDTNAQVAEKAAKKFSGAAAEEVKKDLPAMPAKKKDFGEDQGDYYPTEVHGKHNH